MAEKIDEEYVKRLEQALEFYGNQKYYGDRGEYWIIVNDEGRTARRALGRVEE